MDRTGSRLSPQFTPFGIAVFGASIPVLRTWLYLGSAGAEATYFSLQAYTILGFGLGIAVGVGALLSIMSLPIVSITGYSLAPPSYAPALSDVTTRTAMSTHVYAGALYAFLGMFVFLHTLFVYEIGLREGERAIVLVLAASVALTLSIALAAYWAFDFTGVDELERSRLLTIYTGVFATFLLLVVLAVIAQFSYMDGYSLEWLS